MNSLRRTFLQSATVGAGCLVGSLSLCGYVLADDAGKNLNWQCATIATEARSPSEPAPVVTGVSIQNDGPLIAVVGDDHVVGIFDKSLGRFVRHLRRHTDWVRVAKFSPDGSTLATAGADGKVILWSTSDWSKSTQLAHFGHSIVDIAFHPQGTQLAIIGFENEMRIYDPGNRSLLKKIGCPCKDMRAIAYSPSGQLIAGGGRNGKIEVWNSSSGQSIQKKKIHTQRIRSLDFLNEQTIVSCGDDRKAKLHSIGMERVQELPVENGKLFDVAVLSPEVIATAGSDNNIHIWNVRDKQQIGVLQGHRGSVSCLDSAGATLVSGSFDTNIRVWATGQDIKLNIPSQPRFGSRWTEKIK